MKTTILPNNSKMIEHPDGSKFWYQNGKSHRIDGPAVELSNGERQWFLDGKEISQEEFNERTKKDESKMKTTILPNNSKMIEYSSGTREWFQDGKRHRSDGPAIEFFNGTREWFQNGKRHRIDGPAVEWSNGTKQWLQNGELHRLDGPAIEWSDGDRQWWINGKNLSKEEFDEMIQKQKEERKEETEKTSFPPPIHPEGGSNEIDEKNEKEDKEKNPGMITMQWVDVFSNVSPTKDCFGSMKDPIVPKKKTIIMETKDGYLQIVLEEGIESSNGRFQPIAIVLCILPDLETILHSFKLKEISNAIDHDDAWKIWKNCRERKRMKKMAKKVLKKRN